MYVALRGYVALRDSADFCWVLQDVAGHGWAVSGTVVRCWALLGAVWCCCDPPDSAQRSMGAAWTQPASSLRAACTRSGLCVTQLGAAGICWALLGLAGRRAQPARSLRAACAQPARSLRAACTQLGGGLDPAGHSLDHC